MVVVESSVTCAELQITVISLSAKTNAHAAISAMHSEYASYADEPKTMCGLLFRPVAGYAPRDSMSSETVGE
jgi:hypothetical protein